MVLLRVHTACCTVDTIQEMIVAIMIWLDRGVLFVHRILLVMTTTCHRGIQYQTWEKEDKVFPEDEVSCIGNKVLLFCPIIAVIDSYVFGNVTGFSFHRIYGVCYIRVICCKAITY